MHTRTRRLLLGSFIGLGITVLGGLLIQPELFFGMPHRGISYYGNHFPAVIPYALGYLILVAALLLAAHSIEAHSRRMSIIRMLLIAIAATTTLLLVTPEEANKVFYWSHALVTIVHFIVGGGTAIWIMTHPNKARADWLLLGLMVLGVVICLLSAPYVGVLGFLAIGQVLALLGATAVIVRGTIRWLHEELEHVRAKE
jgi:hypothetical protein